MPNALKTTAAGMAAAAAALAAAPLSAPAAALDDTADTARTAAAAAPRIAWKPCPAKDRLLGGGLRGLECGALRVPLDHDRPAGEKITLALTRARHTAARSQGAVLLNRGGPGAHGRDMPKLFTGALPKDVAGRYDWIGYDPRGVGASRPAMVCDTTYQDPGRPRADTIPANRAEEEAWRERARRYAADCGAKHGRLLPHMGTRAWVRDLDAIRAALGQEKLHFAGYSYGSYLGAAYATAYPRRVGRMVLDSVVKPSGVWYANNLDQNVAFEKRIGTYFSWIARHHETYGLGGTREAVAASYAEARAALKARPAKGRLGASELDDLFLINGYIDQTWPAHARALAAYAREKDAGPLLKEWKPPTWLEQNNYAVYNAVQCRDAAWPRDWETWHRDNWRLYRSGYRFETWSNAWYNAPCAFWPVQGGPRPDVRGGPGTPPILLLQATEDAATPYEGARETHRLFPTSRLVVQSGGGNHGITMNGDACLDGAVAAYFRDGTLPAARPGPDASCPAGPPPAAGKAKRGGPAAGTGHRGGAAVDTAR
ncbi:alpha/beta hydrolase [Actinomadura sp. 21ATH]|uniref:alpha/beta hydrolase n=1 Tax=Actinomadura sp. 21ATH TaxID=1735444 RepID=UPI0035C03CED